MRSIVASAAAGALILGSAAGAAIAKPDKAKGPKDEKPAVVWLKKVDIKRHSPLDISESNTGLTLKVAARVKDRKNVLNTTQTPDAAVDVTLALFDKKVKGMLLTDAGDAELPTIAAELAYVKGKKSEYYKNANVLTSEVAEEKAAIDAALAKYREVVAARAATGQRTFLCLNSAEIGTEVAATLKSSKIVKKRTGAEGVKRPVRDCVKLVIKTPTPAPAASESPA